MLRSAATKNWLDYFGTEDKKIIEEKLLQEGLGWRWMNNDLVVLNKLPGVLKHPVTNKLTWFNSAAYLNYYANLSHGQLTGYKYMASRYLVSKDLLPIVCHYGNGYAFSAEEIGEINRVIESHTKVIHWEKGDFMIVDNYVFMHGKQTHRGDRLLYSCMTEKRV